MKQVIRRTRHPVAAGTLIAAVLIASPFAVAGTGDVLREGKRNGTANKETEIIGNMKAQSGKGGFVTRQSNISSGANAGGGAIYGCRTPVGGTATGTAPCLRASNLAGGNAFEFATSGGPTAGLISIGNPAVPNPGKPFVTNAVGVATGLNADKVDGKDASDLVGAKGAKGDKGDKGDPGPPGPFVDTLPSGKSETGAYVMRGTAAAASSRGGADISFSIPLAAAPTAHFLNAGDAPTADCPGTPVAPTASPGHLCIYEGFVSNMSLGFQDPVTAATGGIIRPYGAVVVGTSTAAGNFISSGGWAVTAP